MDQKRQLMTEYQQTRNKTVSLCQPLSIEDFLIQSIEEVSPPKWHLAHTSWFFETFLLIPYFPNYPIFDPLFAYLFNSYYNGIGKFYPRDKRGLLSKPSLETVFAYRKHIDHFMCQLIMEMDKAKEIEQLSIIQIGMQHEQQHQELLLMDIKYNFFQQPYLPAYKIEKQLASSVLLNSVDFHYYEGGLTWIGNNESTFCFDVELPRHQTFLSPYLVANRLISNGEYAEFIDAGGYTNPDWWLVDGWACINNNKWQAPLYWIKDQNEWYVFTLAGLEKMQAHEPVCHVSYYEADAYARWKNQRLLQEEEWENAVRVKNYSVQKGNFLEKDYYHPQSPMTEQGWNEQLYGDVWEWTTSSYRPYPGYKPYVGVVGEYNGKFMSNQHVLRGGSCVTPVSHIRASYRNFFPLDKRWMFSGIRLGEDI